MVASMMSPTAAEQHANASVLDCLQQNLERIDSAPSCKAEVQSLLQLSLADLRTDVQVPPRGHTPCPRRWSRRVRKWSMVPISLSYTNPLTHLMSQHQLHRTVSDNIA
jgi:hypothetical protein